MTAWAEQVGNRRLPRADSVPSPTHVYLVKEATLCTSLLNTSHAASERSTQAAHGTTEPRRLSESQQTPRSPLIHCCGHAKEDSTFCALGPHFASSGLLCPLLTQGKTALTQRASIHTTFLLPPLTAPGTTSPPLGFAFAHSFHIFTTVY